jgi:hypothetical protein
MKASLRRDLALGALLTASACTGGVTAPTAPPVIAPIASELPAVSAAPTADVAATSAPVPSAPPPRTPTPTPDPAVWRFEGRVVDADGNALKDVCVVVGPRGCQRGSPRTDERGIYFLDLPQVPTVVYDLYFVKDGFVGVWHRVQPREPTVFNVVLRRAVN